MNHKGNNIFARKIGKVGWRAFWRSRPKQTALWTGTPLKTRKEAYAMAKKCIDEIAAARSKGEP